jgi:hypothetical protein
MLIAPIQSNSDHLQHLLLNLTVFCVRVADGSPVLVRCEVRCCSDGLDVGSMAAPMLLLEVSTQGPALSAEQIDAAFNPYSPSSSAAASTVVRFSHSPLQTGLADRTRACAPDRRVAQPTWSTRVAPLGRGCVQVLGTRAVNQH